jgi:hypothetical protein
MFIKQSDRYKDFASGELGNDEPTEKMRKKIA